MRRSLLLGLILCNAIWAANPVMGKILLARHSPLQVAWLRSLSCLAAVLIIAALLKAFRPAELSPITTLAKPGNLRWLAAVGLITFFGSALLQFIGLAQSTATAYVVIIATEPLIALLLAWLFLREKVGWVQMFAFFVSISGFCLLSNLRPNDLAASFALFNFGNTLILLSMFSDAMYSILSRKFAGTIKPFSIFAGAIPFGFIAVSAYLLASGVALPSFQEISPKEWLALLMLGPLGTVITYSFWSLALTEASVGAVSLTLFAQPIIGTTVGYLFLGDRLTPWQGIGAALIVTALCVQTSFTIRRKP